MTCGGNIRRLTPEERADRDEAAAMRYETLYAEVEAQARDEYEREFGPTYKEKHPFKLDAERAHETVIRKIKAEQVGL